MATAESSTPASKMRPQVHPEDTASLCSRWFFVWVWADVVRPAYSRKATTTEDLPGPSVGDNAAELHQVLKDGLASHAASGKRLDWIGLWAVVTRTQWAKLLESTVMMVIQLSVSFAQPLLLEELLDELDDKAPAIGYCIFLAVSMLLCGILASVTVHGFWFAAQRAGIRMTSALTTEVFRKTMSLGPVARAKFGFGQLVQLMSVDAERLSSSYVMPLVQWGSWPPVVTLIVGVFNLHRLLGWPALVAAALLISMPFIAAFYISGKIRAAQERVQTLRDERVRLANEMVRHVRALKALGWEGKALERVLRARRREISAIWSDLSWRLLSGAFVVTVPAVATALSFGLYSLVVGKQMTAAVIFAAMAWMGTLQGPMWQIPVAIRSVVSTSVSLDRLAKFLWASDEAKHALLLDEPDLERTGPPVLARAVSTDSSIASTGDLSGSPSAGHFRHSGKIKVSRMNVVWPEMPTSEKTANTSANDDNARSGFCSLWPCACLQRLWRRAGAALRLGSVAIVCCCPPSVCSPTILSSRRSDPATGARVLGGGEPVAGSDITRRTGRLLPTRGSINTAVNDDVDDDADEHGDGDALDALPGDTITADETSGKSVIPTDTEGMLFTTVITGASIAAGPGLTIILGATGSGKSSLLSSLIGAPLTTGRIQARGSMSFAGQTPWLLNASVKDNITFVSPYREGWFNAVTAACGLTEDLASFTHGIHTAIGERGITISGGQKARVALARAVYADADIVLLDDPLAALDATVAASVLEQCVMRILVMRGRTVIMTTNLLSLARDSRVAAVYLVEPDMTRPGGPAHVRPVPKSEIASVRLDGVSAAGETSELDASGTSYGDDEDHSAIREGGLMTGESSSDSRDRQSQDVDDVLAAPTASGLARSESAGRATEPLLMSEAEMGRPQATALAPLVDDMAAAHLDGSGTMPIHALGGSIAATTFLFEKDLAAYARLLSGADSSPDESGGKTASDAAGAAGKESGGKPASGMMQEEKSEQGLIRFSVFLRYCRSCGPLAFTSFFAAILVLREVVLLSTDLFLTIWIDADSGASSSGGSGAPPTGGLFNGGISLAWLCHNHSETPGKISHSTNECYAIIYSSLTAATVVLAVSMWGLTNIGSVSASRGMHLRLMRALLLTKQAFFDATPVGLILNRAVKDVQKIDLSVAPTVRSFVYNCLRLASAMFLVAVGSPWVLLSVALLAVPYYALAVRFRHAARDLQRLSSSSNSPLLSLFSEAANGASVARAFGAESALLSRHRVLSMSFVTRKVLLLGVEQWATVWLEAFGNVIVLTTAILLIVSRSYGIIPVSIVGFLLTQAQSVPSRLLWVTRNFASLELALIAAERIFQYTDLPDERQQFDIPDADEPYQRSWCWSTFSRVCSCCGASNDDDDLLSGDAADSLLPAGGTDTLTALGGSVPLPDPVSLPDWAAAAAEHDAAMHRDPWTHKDRPVGPVRGRVEIEHLRLQYNGTGAPAIADLSVVFPAGAKIAIVGRSGAGKSSTIGALLRTHFHTGRVLIDGADTKILGPWHTREMFATLQQDAVVLSGSVRQNLLGLEDVLTRMTGISPTSWLLGASSPDEEPSHAWLDSSLTGSSSALAGLSASSAASLHARTKTAARVASLGAGIHQGRSSHLQLRGLGASALVHAGSAAAASSARPHHAARIAVAVASRLDLMCMQALRAVGLEKRLPDLDEQLVSADSLSRGQAQLLGLARCLVRLQLQKCPVLLADEATSSVDRDTDKKVHDVLLALPHTVISICHRLDHIERFDLVLVMGAGRLVEFASPTELLASPTSALATLLADYRRKSRHHDEEPASS